MAGFIPSKSEGAALDKSALTAESAALKAKAAAETAYKREQKAHEMNKTPMGMNKQMEQADDIEEEHTFPATPLARIDRRCWDFPGCPRNKKCRYRHPNVRCSYFPNCRNGWRCSFLHDFCPNDGTCQEPNCAYEHLVSQRTFYRLPRESDDEKSRPGASGQPAIRTVSVGSSSTPNESLHTDWRHTAAPGSSSGPGQRRRCKWFPQCKDESTCTYWHPNHKCRNFPSGKDCRGKWCHFKHPTCANDGHCTDLECAFEHFKSIPTLVRGQLEMRNTFSPAAAANLSNRETAMPRADASAVIRHANVLNTVAIVELSNSLRDSLTEIRNLHHDAATSTYIAMKEFDFASTSDKLGSLDLRVEQVEKSLAEFQQVLNRANSPTKELIETQKKAIGNLELALMRYQVAVGSLRAKMTASAPKISLSDIENFNAANLELVKRQLEMPLVNVNDFEEPAFEEDATNERRDLDGTQSPIIVSEADASKYDCIPNMRSTLGQVIREKLSVGADKELQQKMSTMSTKSGQKDLFKSRFTEEFVVNSVLSFEQFSAVLEAESRLDGRKYAVKKREVDASEQKKIQKLLYEVRAISRLDHPGILPYYRTWIEQPPKKNVNIYVQMQLCNYSLKEWLGKNRTASSRSLPRMTVWFKQMVKAVDYIHEKSILHGNLKPSNILFVSEDRLKLSDPRFIRNYEAEYDGSESWYMSPEQAQLRNYSSKTDIYALGLILLEICTVIDDKDLIEFFRYYRTGERQVDVLDHLPEVKAIVTLLTDRIENQRPDCGEILNHYFMRIVPKRHEDIFCEEFQTIDDREEKSELSPNKEDDDIANRQIFNDCARGSSGIGTSSGKNGPVLPYASKDRRCQYWPRCNNGIICNFAHPTEPCKSFPNCNRGRDCPCLHGDCTNDGRCRSEFCPYEHFMQIPPRIIVLRQRFNDDRGGTDTMSMKSG